MKVSAFYSICLAALTLAIACPLRAQTLSSSPVIAAGADSIVQVTAEAQGLMRVAPENLPLFATYWEVLPSGAILPLPCRPMEAAVFYAITDKVFLADATGGYIAVNPRQAAAISSTASSTAAVQDAAATLSAAVVNLIGQVQTAEVNLLAQSATPSLAGRSSLQALGAPGLGLTGAGGGTLKGAANALVIDTNQLYLTVTGLTNGGGYFQLHQTNKSAAEVFAIWSSTNLALGWAGWTVEQELWPGGTNPIPFTVPLLGRNPLFLRAENWTGVMVNGLPAWWLFYWFGDLTRTADTLDAAGNTLLYDYQNGIDPVPLQFYGIAAANNYVAVGQTVLTLNVSGRPGYMAVVVDNTNFQATAAWQSYTGSNLTVNVGNTEGWHQVWIGLRSAADTPANAVWQRKRLKLDRTPPRLVITSPTNNAVTTSLIQITGYSPEALDHISYDLTNALGTVTNQPVLISDRYYDAAAREQTTNTFQAYDVPLAKGLNVLTLRATDLAGNVTALVTNLQYQAPANPPGVQFIWPQNGMKVCGGSFTLTGLSSDPTAAVLIQAINGVANPFAGRVGRDGQFYLENLPLHSGTNVFTLLATNAAGSALTNLTVIQGDSGLVVDPIAPNQATVTGKINAANYTVWVNGVMAVSYPDGEGGYVWQADNVPLPPRASLVQVTAIPNTDNGGQGAKGVSLLGAPPANPASANGQNAAAEASPSGVYATAYHNDFYYETAGGFYVVSNTYHWADGSGGTLNYREMERQTVGNESILVTWPAVAWPQDPYIGSLGTWLFDGGVIGSGAAYLMGVGDECHGEFSTAADYYRQDSTAVFKLATGGPTGSRTNRLWMASASVSAKIFQALGDVVWNSPISSVPVRPIPYDQITVGVFGPLDDQGNAYKLLADNTTQDVTVQVKGLDHYGSIMPAATSFLLVHEVGCPAPGDTNLSRTTLGIGETVSLFGMPPETVWTLSGRGNLTGTKGSRTGFLASSTPGTATVTATVKDIAQSITFNVVAPSGIGGITVVTNIPLGTYDPNGTTMGAYTAFRAYIMPTNVSFSGLNVREVQNFPTIPWPNGSVTNLTYTYNTNAFAISCMYPSFIDQIKDPLRPISLLFNGTTYTNFSFKMTWSLEYWNYEQGIWVHFASPQTETKYGANGTCQEIYNGVPGSVQGPYRQQ